MTDAGRRRSAGSYLPGSSVQAAPSIPQQQGLSEQQMRDLRQIFDWLDYSGNGTISASELLVALKALQPTATLEQAETFIQEATDGASNSLAWMQFCSVIEKGINKGAASTAAQMFELVRSTPRSPPLRHIPSLKKAAQCVSCCKLTRKSVCALA